MATCEEEEPALDRLLAQAHTNGAVEVARVGGALVRSEEPNVRATAALWSPRTGIIDSHGYMQSLVSAARSRDCTFAWRNRFVGVERTSGGYTLSLAGPSGEIERFDTRCLVNAAGLRSDEVASMGGIDVDAEGLRLHYSKGNYFRVHRRGLVHHLIYPVPPADLAFLGLHVTLDSAGGMRIGPDVEVLGHREPRYDVDEARRPAFFAAASRYLAGIVEEDLVPDQSGVRPKLGSPGGPVRDFVIREESARALPGWVNLVGIESPGLTASLAIAGRVAALLDV